MAIAKMNKVRIISLQTNKKDILQAIQGLQSVELIDLSQLYEQERSMDSSQAKTMEGKITQIEHRHQELEDQLIFLSGHLPKQSAISKLRQPIRKLTLSEIEEEAASINQEKIIHQVKGLREKLRLAAQTTQQIQEDEEFLLKWKRLPFVPNQTDANEYIRIVSGTIPQTNSGDFFRNVKESGFVFVEEMYQNREEHGITIIYDVKEEVAVRQLLEENHFFKIDYPFKSIPAEQLKLLQQKKETVRKEELEAKGELSQMQETEWQLKIMIEATYAKLERLRGERLLIDEPHLFVLEGWMETKKVNWVRDVLAQTMQPEDFAVLTEEVTEEDYDTVPIVLENNKYVEPFENITAMYSMPRYNEIDPTPFLMPFYLVFFGMMLADAGYGLVLLIATTIALKVFHLEKGMQKNMRFFRLLSISTIAWGLIYGSFLGLELPIVPLSIMDDVNTILIISVVFGVIQILLGLGIKSYMYIRDGDINSAVSEGIGWITIFAGIILLVVANLVFPSELLSTTGGIVAIAGAAAVIVASALASANKALGVGVGLYNLYGITGYVGDIVSYTRLMALGVSGGSIGLAFNMIIDFLPPAARFTIGILLFIVLHMVNIGLSSLSAYVHGARLIFVEFFGKFYEGGGKALEPLKTSEEYIELKNKFER